MTKEKVAPKLKEVKALFTENPDVFRTLLQKVVQDALESEMENFLEAAPRREWVVQLVGGGAPTVSNSAEPPQQSEGVTKIPDF